jgi:NADH-quinone oxidoreductase subunit G
MCLVEINNNNLKPIASCAMPINNNLEIKTNTPFLKKIKENILEFLLINHPLDCPICDQGGECDLQDQTRIYGKDYSRFLNFKRSIENKNCNPLIKTLMTRCIHCTRCIRFITEITGTKNLLNLGKGLEMEIGTYINTNFNSELIGNIVDLCPVGALTSKPYAFKTRSWELKSFESIDIFDAIGSNIRIDTKNSEIIRILPRINEEINDEWISDKIRFAFDGLKIQRLNTPFININQKLIPISWKKIFFIIKEIFKKIKSEFLIFLNGNLLDSESLLLLKDLGKKIGCKNIECKQDKIKIENDFRINYLTNINLKNLEKIDCCLLIGTNPQIEAPILNLNLFKTKFNNNINIGFIGPLITLNYNFIYLGKKLNSLLQIIEGKSFFCKFLRKAKFPSIIFGLNSLKIFFNNKIFLNIFNILKNMINIFTFNWNGFNLLHYNVSKISSLDFNLQSSYNSILNYSNTSIEKNLRKFQLLYFLEIDELSKFIINKNSILIYQGHHNDKITSKVNFILPGSCFTEKNSTFINTEGRIQNTKLIFYPPGQAKEDYKIIYSLAEILSLNFNFNNNFNLKNRFLEICPFFNFLNILITSFNLFIINKWLFFHSNFHKLFYNFSFFIIFTNFYCTDSISRASKLMNICTIYNKNSNLKLDTLSL